MATVFWDSEGILLIDYLPRKTTMNGNYYAEVLGKLEKAIKEKRKEKFKNGILLLHDNAPVHKAGVVQDALKKLKFQELNHPPYSPDLAPCDYFLFRKLKKKFRGQIFSHDEELIWEVEHFFAEQEEKHFFDGLFSLISKCKKCVELVGNYIEK
jgi:histone-lysine N-methyltransferase SETMAR